ncbi:MAG: hypothetical protein A2Z35_02015 [Actinobacteria bacterium RBG_19FT_COMBO_36_27]|nr:MAG: hypothetical protein A2Z35_02015 [Actinobacteria bacterium RBG_19FT_COMBO_36_27]
MSYLTEVCFLFDKSKYPFMNKLFELFKNITEVANSKIYLKRTNNQFFPKITLDNSSPENGVSVNFTSDNNSKEIQIINVTSSEKLSNELYSYISIDELINRFNKNNISIKMMDHIGFNLPWFSNGIHPKIKLLRKELSEYCLYHKFPSGEPWDFILPGLKEEIKKSKAINYDLIRKPKLEIVSFDKCSKPIIQFDVTCTFSKDKFKDIFPEGIYDSNLGNIWIYLDNPFEIDFCLVLNEETNGDWSNYFKGNRLLSSDPYSI